jgi:hypothetical protein
MLSDVYGELANNIDFAFNRAILPAEQPDKSGRKKDGRKDSKRRLEQLVGL